ncbi:MAG: hypothetical protein NTW20_04125 [Rhodobacterales bacterium]|nr:hypothetical protein [Rhodobacterales bacterium]
MQTFLTPLVRLASRQPEIEALVFWGGPTGWSATPAEEIESEEIVFYAEGLLQDGFHLAWTVAALSASPTIADHVRLQVWQDDDPPPADLPAGWVALDSARWTAR